MAVDDWAVPRTTRDRTTIGDLLGTTAALLAALDATFDGFSLLRAVRDGDGAISRFEVAYTNEAGSGLAGRDAGALLTGRAGRYAEIIEIGESRLDDVILPGGRVWQVKAARVADDLVAVSYRAAADLQHALLPAALPQVEGARHAVRYLPWTSAADAGGDWYDLIPLAADTVGVVIGDVAGHSAGAAATMGQLRNALRAYALEGHSPTTVMDRLNRLLATVEPDAMATCCYVELHPLEGTATVVLAGHLRPVLCVDGSARPVDARLGPPLGVSPRTGYVDTTVLVPPGAALVLFTDGLVEDRRFPIGRGIAELCDTLAAGRHDDPGRLVDRVLAAGVGPRPRRDDAALLAIRVDDAAPEEKPRTAQRRFHSDASNAAAARRFTADVLGAWDLADLVDTARLLLGELITNAVQHTVGDVELRLLSWPGRLRVEVRDGSDRRPSPRPAGPESESGRGLQIVEFLAESWGFDPQESGGKIVWFELAT